MSAPSRTVRVLGALTTALLTGACATPTLLPEDARAVVVEQRELTTTSDARAPELAPIVSVSADAPGPGSVALVGAVPPPPPAPAERPAQPANRGSERTAPAPRTGGNTGTGTTPRTRSSSGTSAPRTSGSGGSGGSSAATSSTNSDAGFASSLFAAVNSERTGRGLKALSPSSCAKRYAQRWAEHLASTGTFAHQSLGPVLDGCGAMSAGENVARGSSSVSGTVSAWMGSPGHRANILDREFTHAGMATVKMADGRRVSVQVFLTL